MGASARSFRAKEKPSFVRDPRNQLRISREGVGAPGESGAWAGLNEMSGKKRDSRNAQKPAKSLMCAGESSGANPRQTLPLNPKRIFSSGAPGNSRKVLPRPPEASSMQTS